MTYGTYQILCTNGNNVFLPVPIISVLFGTPYVVYAVLFELGAGLFYWSYGVSHFRSGKRLSFKRLVNPNIVALVLGLVLGLAGVSVPTPIYRALEIIGNITVGSAMLIIGALVVSLFEKRFRLRAEVWGVAVHRLLLSPLAGLVFLPFLKLAPELRTIMLLMLSMPPLVTTALVAASFNADEELAAMGVVVPTLLSFVLLPILLALF
jgi:predicted permease